MESADFAERADGAIRLLHSRAQNVMVVEHLSRDFCTLLRHGWLNLTNDDGLRGYRFTYWHQGDLLCVQGCGDTWIYSCLVLAQGCILMFPHLF